MPAWGDMVNTLLLNRQQLQQNQLNQQNTAVNILAKQQEMQRRDQEDQANRAALGAYLQEGNAVADKTLTPSDSDSPIAVAQKQFRYAQQQAVQANSIASRLAQTGGSIELIHQYRADAYRAEQEALNFQKELRLEQKAQSDRVGSIAGSAADPVSFQTAYNQLPKDVRDTLAVDRGPSGNAVWGPISQRSMATLAQQGMTSSQQLDRNIKLQDELRKEQDEKRKEAQDKETVRYHDQEIAVRRSGIAAADRRAERTFNRLGMGQDYKLTKDTQAQIDKIADNYKIRDYKKSAEVADSAASALTDPARGYADVTAPAARTLSDQFKLMIDNYRSRTGGKYQEAELAKMNGLLQRLDKFTETIGEGDKILAKDVMLQTARQMQQLYTDRAVDLTKEELARAKTLKDRGGNPMWLTLHSDVDDLERRGAAKKIESNGKEYVGFLKPTAKGKKKVTPEDFDILEMPSAPEQKTTFVPVPVGE